MKTEEKKGLTRNGGGIGEEEESSRQAKWQNECEKEKEGKTLCARKPRKN